jgi:hypothetical protein
MIVRNSKQKIEKTKLLLLMPAVSWFFWFFIRAMSSLFSASTSSALFERVASSPPCRSMSLNQPGSDRDIKQAFDGVDVGKYFHDFCKLRFQKLMILLD